MEDKNSTALLLLKIAIDNKASIAFSSSDEQTYLNYTYPTFSKHENGKYEHLDEEEFKKLLKQKNYKAIKRENRSTSNPITCSISKETLNRLLTI